MRVLVATTGSDGHVGPLVPFALACQADGREIMVAAPGFAGLPEEQLSGAWRREPTLTRPEQLDRAGDPA